MAGLLARRMILTTCTHGARTTTRGGGGTTTTGVGYTQAVHGARRTARSGNANLSTATPAVLPTAAAVGGRYPAAAAVTASRRCGSVGPVALKAFSPVTAARAASVLCSACAPSTGALMSRSAGRFNTLRRYVAADDVASSSSLPPIEYPELADVLKNEIKFEKKDFQVDEDLDKGPPGDWALQTEDGSITVTLMRKFKNETITVEFFAVDEEDEDAEEDDEVRAHVAAAEMDGDVYLPHTRLYFSMS